MAKNVLLISDVPGHIFHRIGESWKKHLPNPHTHFLNHFNDPHDLRLTSYRHDVIHWIDNLNFTAVSGSLTTPQVVMIHHLTESEYPDFKHSISNADAITTASILWKRRLEEDLRRKIHLIPYTIDSKHFSFIDKTHSGRDEAKKPFILGFVCKAYSDCDGRKGLDLFFKIIRELHQVIPNLEVFVVGLRWEKHKATLDATGACVRRYECGRTEDTKYLYAHMDAMIMTSSEEGGPCNILEAMATGVPVVSSVVGHVPELIQDGETGFLCPNRTVEEYVAKVKMLCENPELRQKIARQAREFIEKEREESIAIPRIDFDGIYDEAIAHFKERPPSELRRRSLQGYCRSLRHYAKKVLK